MGSTLIGGIDLGLEKSIGEEIFKLACITYLS